MGGRSASGTSLRPAAWLPTEDGTASRRWNARMVVGLMYRDEVKSN